MMSEQHEIPVNTLSNEALVNSYTADSMGGSSSAIMSIRDDISRYLSSSGLRAVLQMLREMVENSIDEHSGLLINFWKDPSVTLTILVKLFEDGTALVKDQGRGIPVGLKDIDNVLTRRKLLDFRWEKSKVFCKQFEGPLSNSEVYALFDSDEDETGEHSKYLEYTKDRPYKFVEAPEYERRIAPAIIHAIERDTFGGKGKKGARSKNNAYKKSRTGGVHGAGMCVTLAACETFELINTVRGLDKTFIVGYTRGVRTTEFQEVPVKRLPNGDIDYGLTVKFKPDTTIITLHDNLGNLSDYPYKEDEIRELFANYATGCERINFLLDLNFPNKEPQQLAYKSSDFEPSKLLLEHSKTGKVHEFEFEEEDYSDESHPIDYDIKVACTLTQAPLCRVMVNRLMTSRSTVKDGFLLTLYKAVYTKLSENKVLHPKVPFEANFETRHVGAIIRLGVANPEFSGQVKSEFHDPKLSAILNKKFAEYFNSPEGLKYISELYNAVLPGYRAKVESFLQSENEKVTVNKELQDLRNASKRSVIVNDTLTLPDNRNFNECYCVLVEGRTGAGVLNKFFQNYKNAPNNIAVVELRGKMINIFKNSIADSDGVDVYKKLFHTLSNYPWKRVVVFTDGDTDGYHIRDQITTIMLDTFPEYILQNRFSILESPLAKLVVNTAQGPQTLFVFDQEKLDYYRENEETRSQIVDIKQYKGIGSLQNAELVELFKPAPDGSLLYEYVVQAKDRNLKYDKHLMEQFYGKSTAYRKQFIESHFMTNRFAMYTATRKDRFKDLGIDIDYYSQATTTLSLDTEGLLEKSGLSKEYSQNSIRQGKYLTPVEFLLSMHDKYNANINDIHNSSIEDDDDRRLLHV